MHVDRHRAGHQTEDRLQLKLSTNDTRLFESDNHHGNLVDTVKGRSQPAAPIRCLGALRHPREAPRPDRHQAGRRARWDPAKEDFVGDAAASAMLDRPMRGPWRI